jgi:hypothetical protein
LGRRNGYCWTGVILGFIGNFISYASPFGYLLVLTALILNLIGGYNWARAKGRNGAFCLWGILAPIGFVGLAVLQDRYGLDAVGASSSRATGTGVGY